MNRSIDWLQHEFVQLARVVSASRSVGAAPTRS